MVVQAIGFSAIFIMCPLSRYQVFGCDFQRPLDYYIMPPSFDSGEERFFFLLIVLAYFKVLC